MCKEVCCIIIKESVQQGDITFVNIYVLNIGAPIYVKQILTDLKVEIDSSTWPGGDFNIPLILIDSSPRHKINKEILALTH